MSKSVQSIIDTIPENSKYTVLNSLVSSINCSLVGTANSMINSIGRRLDDPADMLSLSPTEVIVMLFEADNRMDRLRAVRTLTKVRDNLRDQLLAVANDDSIGSFTSSLEFMSQPSVTSRIDEDKLTAALAACGIEADVAPLLAQSAKQEDKRDRERSAQDIARNAGLIEWMHDQVFNSEVAVNDEGKIVFEDTCTAYKDGEWHETHGDIEDLPAEIQDRLYDKLRIALDKARTRAVQRFAINDARYTIDDIIVLGAAIKDAKELEAYSDAEV